MVVRMVTMSLLDVEVERSLVAFVDQEGQDINASAQHLAEEHGAVLLHLEGPESAVLHTNNEV